jgi:hypothetical protein
VPAAAAMPTRFASVTSHGMPRARSLVPPRSTSTSAGVEEKPARMSAVTLPGKAHPPTRSRRAAVSPCSHDVGPGVLRLSAS